MYSTYSTTKNKEDQRRKGKQDSKLEDDLKGKDDRNEQEQKTDNINEDYTQAAEIEKLVEEAKELVSSHLSQSGWKDDVRMVCREYLRDPKAATNIHALEEYVTPKARQLVSDTVKKELLLMLQNALSDVKNS